ncbi:sugar transferase [Pedobacter sp.]|uniref:sugar transferase n=1 Tax=Pedobacter sp. TaxID=1411316 RepID=UPI003D7F7A2B
METPTIEFSPVILFVYKRLDTLKRTCEALKANRWAELTTLYIYSDHFKGEKDRVAVLAVRDYIHQIKGFKAVNIIEAVENRGLANSIILGVTSILEKYGRAIVLEDDLITSKNFLIFMNQALNYYQDDARVYSIAGYTIPITPRENEDVYFTQRASSWGWATWIDRWDNVDWNIKDYPNFSNDLNMKRNFNRMGSDMTKMLNDQMIGKINSWAIRWCYHQFKTQQFTVYPVLSKVLNIGNGHGATNTRDGFSRFKTNLDTTNKISFSFKENVQLEEYYLSQFLKQFSVFTRVKFKVLNMLKF